MIKRVRDTNINERQWRTVLWAFIAVYLWVVTLWTDRNLEFWISYFKDEPIEVNNWLSFLATLFAPITVTLNVIAEIARVCI